MHIHQSFKDMFKELRDEIKVKYWLTDIDNVPNETIIQSIENIFESDEARDNNQPSNDRLFTHELISDTGAGYRTVDVIRDATAIDDQYIWTSNWLFRWTGLADIINHKIITELEQEELFPINKIVRVCAPEKLRNMWYITSRNGHWLREYIGKHFKVIGYNKDWFTIPDEKIDSIITVYTWDQPHKKVYVEDAYWSIYIFPQDIFVRTSIKDLVIHEREQALNRIIEDLQNSAKFDIDQITNDYQESLRKFMDISKILEQKMSNNFREEAEKILEMQLNTKEILERNVQIESVEYIVWQRLHVNTKPLLNNNQPIGKYRITLDLTKRNLRIINLDIWNINVFQHPHINRNGECCLWSWMNPLRESYSKTDYITLVAGIISYLESLYEWSVYIWLWEFCDLHAKKFAYQTKKTKPKAEKLINGITPDVIIMDEALVHQDLISETYNIGDMVTVIDNDQSWHPIWTVWIITEIQSQTDWYAYRVNSNGRAYTHSWIYLSLVQRNDG